MAATRRITPAHQWLRWKARAVARANADTAFLAGWIIGAAIENRRHHHRRDSSGYDGYDGGSDGGNCDGGWNC
jgi:hypothetical protein